MGGPNPLMIGDELALADSPDSIQVGDDLDPPADHTGVDRVVVAIQADVVIARQPQRGSPSSRRRDWRHSKHSPPVGGDPTGRGAAPPPPGPGAVPPRPAGGAGAEVLRAGGAA